MSNINWNDGRLITLKLGDLAVCENYLNPDLLYGIFFYNAAGNETDTTIDVMLSGATSTIRCVVPGTLGNQGLTAICFVDGATTKTLSASLIDGQPDVEIEAIICSVNIPKSIGKTIHNNPQPINRNSYNFDTLAKYFKNRSSKWYAKAYSAI